MQTLIPWDAIAEVTRKNSLDSTQHLVLELAAKKHNLIVVGDAGTGKSRVNRSLQELFKLTNTPFLCVCPTNMAALVIQGSSIHRGLSIPVKDDVTPEQLAECICNDANARVNWMKPSVWIFDEFSMIHCRLITLLEKTARLVRKNNVPWGKIQVIFIGDVLQLPPIDRRRNATIERDGMLFPFESPSWIETNFTSIVLKNVYRQKEDLRFVKFLRFIRLGILNESVMNVIRERSHVKLSNHVQLVCKKKELQGYNMDMLSKLSGPVRYFYSSARISICKTPKIEKAKIEKQLIHNCNLPSTIGLKIGTQVRLLSNLNRSGGIVNGICGTVIDFRGSPISYPLVDFPSAKKQVHVAPVQKSVRAGRNVGIVTQVPLALAYTGTIHAYQGQTLDCAEMILGEAFEHGQVYTALSRVTKLENISIKSFPEKILVNPKALEFTAKCKREFDKFVPSEEGRRHYETATVSSEAITNSS